MPSVDPQGADRSHSADLSDPDEHAEPSVARPGPAAGSGPADPAGGADPWRGPVSGALLDSLHLLQAAAAAGGDDSEVRGGPVLDAILAAGRVMAWAQAQQLRWMAAFARPGVAVPISAVLTDLGKRPGSLLHSYPLQPEDADFAPGTRWEQTSIHGDPVWQDAVAECAIKLASVELSAAMRTAQITATAKLVDAVTVNDRLPATRAALESGVLAYGHVAVMLDATRNADDTACATVEDRLVTTPPTTTDTTDNPDDPDDETDQTGPDVDSADDETDPDDSESDDTDGDCDGSDDQFATRPAGAGSPAASMTPGQLGRAAAAAVIDADPEAAHRRAQAAHARRGTGTRSLGDDMSRFHADLLATDAAIAHALLDALARDLPTEHRDGRGISQRRADIFADLFTHLATHGHIDLRTTTPHQPPTDDQPPCDDQPPADDPATDTTTTDPAETPVTDQTATTPADQTAGPQTPVEGATTDDQADDDQSQSARAAAGETAEDLPAADEPPGDQSEPDPDAEPEPEPVVDDLADRIHALRLRPGFTATLDITIALSTLAALDNHHAHLAGHGPITADLARAIATACTKVRITAIPDPPTPLERNCDHPGCHQSPDCGSTLDRGTSIYQPPDTLADHVRHRDRQCRFPGCQQPAHRCDLDHRTTHADKGPTCSCNLDALCRQHHRAKTFTTWHATRTTTNTTWTDNTLTWTSPLNNTYPDPPPPVPTGTTFTTKDLGRHDEDGDGPGTHDATPPF